MAYSFPKTFIRKRKDFETILNQNSDHIQDWAVGMQLSCMRSPSGNFHLYIPGAKRELSVHGEVGDIQGEAVFFEDKSNGQLKNIHYSYKFDRSKAKLTLEENGKPRSGNFGYRYDFTSNTDSDVFHPDHHLQLKFTSVPRFGVLTDFYDETAIFKHFISEIKLNFFGQASEPLHSKLIDYR